MNQSDRPIKPLGWEGDWPDWSIKTLDDLKRYLEFRRAGVQVFGNRPTGTHDQAVHPHFTERFLKRGREALRNVPRVFDQLGVTERPTGWPKDFQDFDGIPHHDVELRLIELIRWLGNRGSPKSSSADVEAVEIRAAKSAVEKRAAKSAAEIRAAKSAAEIRAAKRAVEKWADESKATRAAPLSAGLTAEELAEMVAEKVHKRSTPARGKPKRRAKVTGRQPAAVKILAGLAKHHEYYDGICQNATPIVVKAVAREWHVSVGSISNYLKRHFGDYDSYVGKCNRGEIATELKRLRDEYQARNVHSLPADGEDA